MVFAAAVAMARKRNKRFLIDSSYFLSLACKALLRQLFELYEHLFWEKKPGKYRAIIQFKIMRDENQCIIL